MHPSPASDAPLKLAARPGRPWSPLHLALFRFIFSFISLYTLDLIALFFQRQHRLLNGDYPKPFPEPLTATVWRSLIPWIGTHLLHLAHPVAFHSQVGQDSPYEYILRGTQLVLALLIALIWSILDRHRPHYRTLDAYLRIFVRSALVAEMLFYGLAKVPPAQFGVLSLYRLAQPLSQLWPMAMLWAFMATSPGYTLLCGLVETAGGLLLLTRRTTPLGALISAGAMANVLALNIFYDVNQKIRCVGYLLLALYLAAPQLLVLWNLLVRQRPTTPSPEPTAPGPRPLRIALSCMPLLFAILLMAHFIPSDIHRYNTNRYTDTQRGPNYGVWRVTTFTVADPNKPLLSKDVMTEMHLAPGQDRWQQLILDAGNQVYLQIGNGEYDNVEASQDPKDPLTGDTLLSDSGDPTWHARLHFDRSSPTTLSATGTVNDNPVTILFTLEPIGQTHLTDPPRWVSDGRRW